eukprot:4931817-Amphidinium_carterae.1
MLGGRRIWKRLWRTQTLASWVVCGAEVDRGLVWPTVIGGGLNAVVVAILAKVYRHVAGKWIAVGAAELKEKQARRARSMTMHRLSRTQDCS